MLVSDVQRRVQSILGDQAAVFIENGDVIDWINDGVTFINMRMGLVRGDNTTNSVLGQENYSLPVDFIRFVRTTYNGIVMTILDPVYLDLVFPNRDVSGTRGTPRYYWVDGRDIRIYPVPDTAIVGGLKYRYVKQPTFVTANGDDIATVTGIPAFMHPLIVRFCILRGKEQDEEFDVVQAMEAAFNAYLAEIHHEAIRPYNQEYSSIRDVSELDYTLPDWNS